MSSERRFRTLLGMLAVAVGLILFLRRSGNAEMLAGVASRWWPAVLIVLLLLSLATFLRKPFASDPAPVYPAVVLSAATVLCAGLLSVTTGWLVVDVVGLLLPLLLIVAGLDLALFVSERADVRPYFSAVSVLRRRSFRSACPTLRNVTIVSALGDAVVDLSDADLWGGPVEVHATVWYGRIYLRFPTAWRLRTERHCAPTVTMLDRGGVGSPPGSSEPDGPDEDGPPTLAVHVVGARGRVEFRNG